MQLASAVEKANRLGYNINYGYEDGKFYVRRTVNADPVFESIKYRTEQIKHSGRDGKAGQRYIGSLDPITAARFAQECGAAIGTREFEEYAIKQITKGDYTRFKADL